MSTISLADLTKLIDNQKECKSDAPVTSVATFRLSELKSLITAIENNQRYNKKDDEHLLHNICITFVREKLLPQNSMSLFATHHFDDLMNYGTRKIDEHYSQLVPIIAGCVCKLDGPNYSTSSFEYLSNKDKKIPFIRPGGEGTGLIPPPPKT